MKKIISILIFLNCWMVFSNDKLELANEYLNKSDLRKAIILYEELSQLKVQNEQPKIFTQALIGLAEAYLELGTHHLSIYKLNALLFYLNNSQSKDFILYAKIHQLLADNYDYLFLHKEYLIHVNKFIHYYRLSGPDFQIYEAVYYAYLGRYYNLKFDMQTAFNNTSKALDIYHKNRQQENLIDVYKLYESHCLTLRNYAQSEGQKEKYIDTLRQKILKLFPANSLKLAKALIPISSVSMDYAYNTLSNPKTVMSDINRKEMVLNVCKNYEKGIRIYNSLNIYNHNYLPRYYDIQSWVLYGNKEYQKALQLLNKGIESYSNNTFLDQGFVANNYRVISSVRLKALVLRNLTNEEQNPDTNKQYLQTLLLYEKLWETFLLELIQDKSDFTSNMYNENPYQYLFEYYAKLYTKTNQKEYLRKAHQYEEKSKYGALFTTLSLSDKQKENRIELTRLKKKINLLMDYYFCATFLGKSDQENLKLQIEKTIKQYNNYREESNKNFKIQELDVLQKNLKSDQALISYSYVTLGKYELYAKIITKEKSSLVFLGKSDSSKKYLILVDDLNKSLNEHNIVRFKILSRHLYKELFEPLKGYLPKNIRKLEILPFPDIENLPFDLLLSYKSPSLDFRKLPYLANDFSFFYTLSSSIKQLNVNKEHIFERDLDVFKPSFKSDTESELNYANKNTKQLYKSLDAKFYYNDDATIENFKHSLSTAKTVKLISHGRSTKNINSLEKGVYLQDGFLSMDKIYDIKAKTDFLILTACQTGVGFKDRGEGNINLLRAFRSIGIKSIMFANWKIDERTSLDILNGFFEHLNKGIEKSEALKNAKMDYLNTCIPRYGNPIYWAGINIIGDNGPVVLGKLESKKTKLLWWAVIILISIFVILYKIKKRP